MTRKLFTSLLCAVALFMATVCPEAWAQGTRPRLPYVTFANLGTPANGVEVYCTDCIKNTDPCTSGGTGAFASRINGAWVCGASAGAVDSLQTSTEAGLPTAGTAGRVRLVTDSVRGIYTDTGSQWVPQNATIINPLEFGAKGNMQSAADASMTASSTTLTTTAARFVAADVGKSIVIEGAAGGGGSLGSTIAAFTSSTQVTLATAATTAISNKGIYWGTDDITAFTNAIAACPIGGTVLVPKSHYLSTTLIINKRIQLQGAGPGSTLGSASGITIEVNNSTAGAVIQNLTLIGSASPPNTDVIGVRLTGSSTRTRITNLTTTGVTATLGLNIAIHIASTSNKNRIDQSRIENLIGTAPGQGYGVLVESSDDNLIDNNQIIFSSTQGRHQIYLSVDSDRNIILGNRMESGTNAQIQIYASGTDPGCSFNLIQGNTLDGQTSGSSAAILLAADVTHNKVSSNYILSSAGFGVYLEGFASPKTPKFNVIENNQIYQSAGEGVRISGAQQNVVQGNFIYESSQAGTTTYCAIGLYPLNSVAANNNNIIGNVAVGTAFQRCGVMVTSGTPVATNNVIIGNSFPLGTTGTPIQDSGSGTIIGPNNEAQAAGFELAMSGPLQFEAPNGFVNPTTLLDGQIWWNPTQKSLRVRETVGTLGLVGVVYTLLTPPAAIATTTTETNFGASYTFPANSLTVGKTIRVTAYGTYNTSTTPTITTKVKLGSTVLATTNAWTSITGTINRGWEVHCDFTVISVGTAGTVEAQGMASYATGIATANTSQIADMRNTAVVGSINTTTTQQLQLSWTWSISNASNTATLRHMTVQILD